MTVEEFLANGGVIKRCPTVYLLPTINAVPINSGVSDRDDPKSTWKRGGIDGRPVINRQSPQSKRKNEKSKARAEDRYAEIRRSFDAGISPKEISVMNAISVERVKTILRATGISFAAPAAKTIKNTAKPTMPKPIPRQKYDFDEMVRLYTQDRMTINQVATKIGCSNITVRRACSLAGVTRIQGKKPYSPIQAAELESRKAEARKLRSEGLSYKAIGAIMGKNHETVRTYCDDTVAEKKRKIKETK